ncbi:hypothetical protein C8Q80DRAFT_1098929 [Daedaleopsis nitida]|nr:hypothetical protein C8Q80DRAFT_1098929 [Daedaleopsis nitida]
MPLVVPVLRLAYVFLNVFETFKTLRLPRPSARNGGQPSARAMSARKRAMKGCMTVWLVWVCFMLYERWVEAFVWLFVPFYDEIKSLLILFFIVTRAKGAEPIYLHVMRPLIKPYSGALDALFDALASFGDLFVLVASIPVNYLLGFYRHWVLGFYRRWTSALDPPQADPQSWHQDDTHRTRPSAHRAYVSESNGDARPAPAQDASTGSVRQAHSTILRSDATTLSHQIWHPPASAYAEDLPLNPHSGLPTPPIERQQQFEAASPTGSDDWRQYPPFPSAYPPTPLPASSRLPSAEPSIVAPRPVRPTAQFADITEEDEDGHGRQDFRRSLLLPREPRNPGSDGDLSDENHMEGVQTTQIEQSHDRQSSSHGSVTEMSVDEERVHDNTGSDEGSAMDGDEDEDMFNTTLRTPPTRRHYRRQSVDLGEDDDDDNDYLDDLMLTPPRMRVAYSIDSVATWSTGLSTTDNGSSLRTRTNSLVSIAPSSVLDTTPLAGKKRRVPPRYAEDDVKFSVEVPASKAAATGDSTHTRAASRASSRSRSGTVGRRREKTLQDTAESTTADDAEGEEDISDVSSSGAKRQRVAEGRVVRPKPPRGDSQGTIRAPSTRAKKTSAAAAPTRSAVTRAPSARVAAARKERPSLPSKKASTGTVSIASVPERKTGVGKVQKTKTK